VLGPGYTKLSSAAATGAQITLTGLSGLTVGSSNGRVIQDGLAGLATRSRNRAAKTEQHSVNTENRVTQDSGGRKPEEVKGVAPSWKPAPRWCPRGITKTQRHRLQKRHQKELAEKKDKEQRDYWFNHLRPMTKVNETSQEKRLAKEENGSSGDNSNEGEVEVTSDKGGSNPELGNNN
jgi:hypothetical protein